MKNRILLVDDTPRDLRLFERGLASAGFVVAAFGTTEEAGDQLLDEPDVLATTDLAAVASTVARWTDASRAHSSRRSPGLLVLLAADQRAERGPALAAGADEVLSKPIPVAELVSRVTALCRQRARDRLRGDPLVRGKHRSGDLCDLGPADLLSILEEREQSGILRLEDQNGANGAIFLRRGKVVDAEVGKLTGVEALSLLASWTEGTFRIEIKTIRRADKLSTAVDDVLVSAALAPPATRRAVVRPAGPTPVVAVTVPSPGQLDAPDPEGARPVGEPEILAEGDDLAPFSDIAPDVPPLPPPAPGTLEAESAEDAVAMAGEADLDELDSAFARVQRDAAANGSEESGPARGRADVGHLPEGGERVNAGASPTEEEHESSMAWQRQAGSGASGRSAAELEADARAAVMNNMTLPLGLAGHGGGDDPSTRGAGALVDDGVGDQSVEEQLGLLAVSARAPAPWPAEGRAESTPPHRDDAESDDFLSAAGTSSMLQDGPFGELPGVTPNIELADGTAETSAPGRAAGMDVAATETLDAPSPPPQLPAWVEALATGNDGGDAGAAGHAGFDETGTEDAALQALGLGGKRRLLRFVVLALGVAGILGVVGVHHAMAKRKIASLAAAHLEGEPTAAAAPGRLASRAGETKKLVPTAAGDSDVAAGLGGTPAARAGTATAREMAEARLDRPVVDHATPETPSVRQGDIRPGTPALAGVNEQASKTATAGATATNEAAGQPTKHAAGDRDDRSSSAPRIEAGAGKAKGSAEPEAALAVSDQAEFRRALATCRARLDRGHAQQAARACQGALAAKPDAADALSALAHAELNQRHLAQAIAAARHAIALDPALAEPYLILGGALQDSGHSHEAGVAYRAYLARAPHGKYAADLRVIVSTM